MQPILYSNYNCPHSLKIAFFLSEKGIEFQRIEVDLNSKEQKTPAYLCKNPRGTVPAYEDEAGVIGDSLEIMRYVDARLASVSMFPDEPDQLTSVLRWIDRGDTEFWDVSHHLYWQLIEPPATGTDWEEVERLKEKGLELLAELEDILAVQAFICMTFSAADITLVPWVYGYRRFDLVNETQFPNVVVWLEELSKRASFTSNYRVKGNPFQDVLARQRAK